MASVAFSHLTKKVLVDTIKEKSITKENACPIKEEGETWMVPILKYLMEGTMSVDKFEARNVRVNAPNYSLRRGVPYKRGFGQPWLRCVGCKEASKILAEVHAGVCGSYAGSSTTAQKLIWIGYFWSTAQADA